MYERAAWALALVATITVLGHSLQAERRVNVAERRAYERTVFKQNEAIGALRTALQGARETLLVSERMRRECHEGIGLSHLRQRFLLEHLGLSEYPEDVGR